MLHTATGLNPFSPFRDWGLVFQRPPDICRDGVWGEPHGIERTMITPFEPFSSFRDLFTENA
jgi:hypothetical protein